MKIELGIMQGRLSDKPGQSLQSFPYLTWKDEFFLARNFGLDHIEYLVDDVYDTLNPITNKEGRNQIAQLSKESNIKVNSLCAHTFISDNFLDPSNNSNIILKFEKIIEWCKQLNINYINVPIDGLSNKKFDELKNIIVLFDQLKIPKSINILIETDLSAEVVKIFLSALKVKNVNIVYDLGNANALKFNFVKDFKILHKNICEIHLNDRSSKEGNSCRLGSLDTPFKKIASELNQLRWSGLVTLETPIFTNWKEEAVHNISFAKNWIKEINKEI